MVGPLVHYPNVPFAAVQMADRILGQYSEPHPGDHISNAMVDLRIGMIGMTAEQNPFRAGCTQELQRFLAFRTHILFGMLRFGQSRLNRSE
ncbi:hypothetical protein D3C81_1947660 [compost metagenome]